MNTPSERIAAGFEVPGNEPPTTPTILPWHREAARCAVILALQDQEAAWEDIAEVIAARDPHAETVRLLEEAVYEVEHFLKDEYSCSRSPLTKQIRDHLATLQPAAAAKITLNFGKPGDYSGDAP